MAWRSPPKFQGVLQSDAGVLTQGGIFVTNGVPYDNAISTLQVIKQNLSAGDNTPFFLAAVLAFTNLTCRSEPLQNIYYDLYPPVQQIEPPKNPDVPTGFPPIARALVEIMSYEDIKNFYPNMTKCRTDVQASLYGKECRIPEDYSRVLRRAYYSCVI